MRGRGAMNVHPHAASWALSFRQYLKHSIKGCRKSEQNPSLCTGYMMLGRFTCGNSLQLLLRCLHGHCNTRGCFTLQGQHLWSSTHLALGREVLDMQMGCWTWTWGVGHGHWEWAATGLSGKGLGPQLQGCPGCRSAMILIHSQPDWKQ